MTVWEHNMPTALDVVRSLDGAGNVVPTVELLHKTCELADFLPWVEATDMYTNRTDVRTGLPEVYYRSINKGIPPSTATHASVLDPMATLQSLSEVDTEAFRGVSDKRAVRWKFDKAHPQALGNKLGEVLVYGNPANDENEILGLYHRFNDPTAGNADNILNCSADSPTVGNLYTEMYCLGLSEETVFCPYPKGSMGGIEVEDLGEYMVQTEETSAGSTIWKKMKVAGTLFTLRHGLAVANWQAVARLANIKVTDLKNRTNEQDPSHARHIFNGMSRALDRVLRVPGVTPVFVANATMRSYLRVHARYATGNVLSILDGYNQFGMPRSVPVFNGAPVLLQETILNNLPAISGLVA